ncbi:MAG: DNA-formamidopyrimidine glycosylase family protein [Pseudomonadota bacterium]
MPELPDLTTYVEALRERVVDHVLEEVQLASPFLLRTVEPALDALYGHRVIGVERLAKQLVFSFEHRLHFVIHLMISGRLQWSTARKAPPKRNGLAAFHFASGTMLFTEASKKKRASLRVVDDAGLEVLDPGGLELFAIDVDEFGARLRSVNHTLKRALTDQRVFAGIGNAYSDEILLRARMSPFKQSGKLSDAQVRALYEAARVVLTEWVDILRAKAAGKFPTKVTAFHEEMAAHGKYKAPCPVCDAPIQRIVYAENEANYCARCQTDGKLLADRSLSRLLKDNWPKRLEDLENL